jgi:hypothetical protein
METTIIKYLPLFVAGISGVLYDASYDRSYSETKQRCIRFVSYLVFLLAVELLKS